jgi:DNA-binding IclR family transcriptional regulator
MTELLGDKVQGVQSLDRMLLIVETICSTRKASVAELCYATGLSKPTTWRHIYWLEQENFIKRLPDGRFRLSVTRFAKLAVAARDNR